MFKKLSSEMGGIVVVSIMAGFLFNAVSPNRISLIYSANNNPFFSTGQSLDSREFPQIIGLNEAKAYFDAETAIFVDARPVNQYTEGHIPGAVSLPLEDFEKYFANIEVRLPKNHTIVVYCDNISCESSTRLVYRLLKEGYLYCYIFENGIRHWQTVGYPVEEGYEENAR